MPVNPPPADLPASDLSDLRLARAYLVRVAEPPALALSAFIDAHGPVDAARRVQAQQVPEPVALETGARHRLDRVDADIAAAARVGARLVIPEDEEWPTHLIAALTRTATATGASWAAPPIALWMQSEMTLRDALTNAYWYCAKNVRAMFGRMGG
jgi:DNA processing protein